jgi:hypothetical protein
MYRYIPVPDKSERDSTPDDQNFRQTLKLPRYLRSHNNSAESNSTRLQSIGHNFCPSEAKLQVPTRSSEPQDTSPAEKSEMRLRNTALHYLKRSKNDVRNQDPEYFSESNSNLKPETPKKKTNLFSLLTKVED